MTPYDDKFAGMNLNTVRALVRKSAKQNLQMVQWESAKLRRYPKKK